MELAAQSIPQRSLSQLERVLYTFISPSQTFKDVLRNRSWWLALALTVLTSFFYSYTVIQKVGVDQTVQNMVQRNATLEHQLESDTPKQRAGVLAGAQTSLRWSMALEPVIVVLFNLFLAGIFLASFNVVFGTKLNYALAFSILLWADLINTIKPVCTAISLWMGYPAGQFDFQNPIGTDLAYYLPNWGNPAMKSMLFSLDAVMIWYLIVLAIGFSMAGKLRVGQTAAVVFGWWCVLVFARIALASIGAA